MPVDTLLLTAVGFLLVLLNGFFVAAEFAIVKLRRTQAEELALTEGLRGRILRIVRTHLDVYLSACQLGITLASLGLGWIGEPAFARLIEPVLELAGITDPEVVHSIAFAFAFGLISFLHIVLGELAPKSLAIRRAESVSLNTALPLYVFYWIMYPFIWLLNGAANSLLRRLGVEMATEGDEAHSIDELRTVLRASHRHGEVGTVEAQIAYRGLELGELVVGDVMRPLGELVWVDEDATIEDVLEEVRRTRFTRYPVRDRETQRFIGLLHIKDLITAPGRLRDIGSIRQYLRPLPHVRENEQLEAVLAAFRRGDPHFGIVVDPLETEIGFLTFEHVVESLFGPVEDEFAKSSPSWRRAPDDGSVTGAGSLSILSLESELGVVAPVVEANSVGGLVIETLGRIPRVGDRVQLAEFEIEVLSMHGPRIGDVRVRRTTPEAGVEDASG
ncbi:MAG TPA: hemolysin family protein [Steroidobacteraceae bacterium]|nr:hemolysin family protein [Steroidobacteraceae bacterium]